MYAGGYKEVNSQYESMFGTQHSVLNTEVSFFGGVL